MKQNEIWKSNESMTPELFWISIWNISKIILKLRKDPEWNKSYNEVGVWYFSMIQKLLKKHEIIFGEITADNTSIEMRNMGVSI